MLTKQEAQQRVGQVDSLPAQDVFGGARHSGWNVLGVDGLGYVAYPPVTRRIDLEAAIEEIKAALTEPKRQPKKVVSNATEDDQA